MDYARRQRFAWAEGVQTLYKLRSLAPGDARDHTLDILENSRLYFPSPAEFNDPFDCYPPFDLAGDWRDPQFAQELEQTQSAMIAERGLSEVEVAELRLKEGVPIEKLADTVREFTIRDLRRDTRVLCLAKEHLHPLMWSHYAASHTGICLQFRVTRDGLFGNARRVIYREERQPVLIPLPRQSEDEVADRLGFIKAQFWDYESEYRVIAWPKDEGLRFDEQHRVAFDPELLCGITLGMKISAPDRDLMLSLAVARQPRVPVWQARENRGRFWIEVQPIQK